MNQNSFSLIPNERNDRASENSRPGLGNYCVAPRTVTNQQLAAIWREVLDIEQVGLQDDFFDLGGHSLLAIQVLSRIRKAFEVDVSVRTLFELPTIAQLAARIDSMRDFSVVDKTEREQGIL